MDDFESTQHRVDDLLRRYPRRGAGVVEALEGLCSAMSDDLALVGSVVTLMPTHGAHAISAHSSSPARQVEEAQFGVAEGPTLDAFADRRPVLIADLNVAGVRRWPGWAPTALAAGVCAAYAFPLQVGASIFGVLAAYAGPGVQLDARRLEIALVYAEAATQLLLDRSMPADGHELEADLDATLATHGDIYQAQGMVMVELGVSLPEALARMRAHAWSNGQDLATLAGEILAGRTMPARDPR